MATLKDYLPRYTYCVASAYSGGRVVAQVAGCTFEEGGGLRLSFPKPHGFAPGERITVHLDDRTGVESLDASLRVYRGSYRGFVDRSFPEWITVKPAYCELYYGSRLVLRESWGGYAHPADERTEAPPPPSPLRDAFFADEREAENKLGVLISRAELWPHTTVMAFLSTREDDVFLISHRASFKSTLLRRDRRCCFAIDHRSTFLFEKAYDWNFTILEMEASLVVRENPLFERAQEEFVRKNPWELVFFTDPQAELFHLRPLGILCAGGERLS